jgi:hypothetical protein
LSHTSALIFGSARSFMRDSCSAQFFASGQTCDRNAMRLESGNHFGAITPVGTLVTRRASPPFTGIT